MAPIVSSKFQKNRKLFKTSRRLFSKLVTKKLRRSLRFTKHNLCSKTPLFSIVEDLISPPVKPIHYNEPSIKFEYRLSGHGVALCQYCTLQIVGDGIKTVVSRGPCSICAVDDLDAYDTDYAYHPAHSMVNALFDDDVETDWIYRSRHDKSLSDESMVDVYEFANRWVKDNGTKKAGPGRIPCPNSITTADYFNIWSVPTIVKERNRNGNKEPIGSLFNNRSMIIQDTYTESTSMLTENSVTFATVPPTLELVIFRTPLAFRVGNPCNFPFPLDKIASFGLGEGFVGLLPITAVNKEVINTAIQTANKNMESAGLNCKYRFGLMVAWDRNHRKGVAAVLILPQGNQKMISE